MEEGKKAAAKANKEAAKNKVNKEAKKIAERNLIEMAAALPVGESNTFLKLFSDYCKAVTACRAAAKVKGSIRKQLKSGIKVDMAAFDRVFKLFEMDPTDVAARKATEALYEKQLGLELSSEQKEIVDDLIEKREDARIAMANTNGGDTGKEVGSAAKEGGEQKGPLPTLPERNERLSSGFRPRSEVAATH